MYLVTFNNFCPVFCSYFRDNVQQKFFSLLGIVFHDCKDCFHSRLQSTTSIKKQIKESLKY